MQRNISNKIQLGNTLNLVQDYGGIPAVDNAGNLENVYSKVDKKGAFWKTGMKIYQDTFQIFFR